jgi:hypothetical protein
MIIGWALPALSSEISISRSTRAPTASAYSCARCNASAIAALRTSAPAVLPGRSRHHGPATAVCSLSARRSSSSPSTSKSVTVTVVVTLPAYAEMRSPPRLSSG